MKNAIFLFLITVMSTVIMAQDGYDIGDTVTDFSLINTNDSMTSMAGFQDANGYIVIFSCNHCPFVVAYEDRMIALQEKFAPLGYPVIAINPNNVEDYPSDSFDNMKIRAAEKNFTFDYAYDESQEVARQFGATRTPHVFLLDAEKTVQYIGAIDDNAQNPNGVSETYLENAINALRNNEPIDPAFTKAIGCSIKWK